MSVRRAYVLCTRHKVWYYAQGVLVDEYLNQSLLLASACAFIKDVWAYVGPRRENLSSGVSEQQKRRPVCADSLISAFVIRLLESRRSRLAIREISDF